MGRKITVNLHMSLDGYGDIPEYPGSNVKLAVLDEFRKDMWMSRNDSFDTIMYGRNSWEGHAQVHALLKINPADPKFLFDFSKFVEKCEPIVLSNTLEKAAWWCAKIMKGKLEEIVPMLKSEPGKDIIVDTGPSLAHEFIKNRLADDCRTPIFPVIPGKAIIIGGQC